MNFQVKWEEPLQKTLWKIWGCENRYPFVIFINNGESQFILEYTDYWSLPEGHKQVEVKIKCSSIIIAKIMADKAAKELDKYMATQEDIKMPWE